MNINSGLCLISRGVRRRYRLFSVNMQETSAKRTIITSATSRTLGNIVSPRASNRWLVGPTGILEEAEGREGGRHLVAAVRFCAGADDALD